MDQKIVKKLMALNDEFYADFAQSFAASRTISDPALTCVLPYISSSARVLDVGCGNGRLAVLLDQKCPKATYLGIDSVRELVGLAQVQKKRLRAISAEFRVVDITFPGWGSSASLRMNFDCVVILAVLHHLPSFDLRAKGLREAAGLLAPGGRVILSVWQFLDSPRMRRKIVDWERVGMAKKDLEKGDYLLTWKRNGKGLRYCHLIDKKELVKLADEAGLSIKKTWRAGGQEGNLSLFAILEKNLSGSEWEKNMLLDELILTIIERKVKSKSGLEKLKKVFAKKHAVSVPKTYQLLKSYRNLLARKKIRRLVWLEELLVAKPVRTLSGVTPLAVLTKPYPCPGECLYCPDQDGVPKSYLADEPAVLRARQFNFDPGKQVKYRLDVFGLMGHRTAKIELIILGGTFSYYPKSYREEFIKACFEAANQKKATTLLEAQGENEKSKRRIIGITVETRPDLVDGREIKFLRKLGVTRVELGVQSLYPLILKRIKRGHGVGEVVRATKMLRNAGFKICYHLMPGLPGSNFAKDVLMFKKIFSDLRFKPDFLKIYPLVVLKETSLYEIWKRGKFKPLTDRGLVKLLVEIKKVIPPYVRINRLGRDIPVGNIVAGYRYSHIRQLVKKELDKKGLRCKCVRCREIKNQNAKIKNQSDKLKFKILKYKASGGRESFLEFVDRDNRLYALLRLCLPPKKTKPIFPVLENAGLVRELHTYGQSLAIGERKLVTQHRGLGKKLLEKAEEIAKENGFSKMAVISGVGVRDYYRSLGYKLYRTYMVKVL